MREEFFQFQIGMPVQVPQYILQPFLRIHSVLLAGVQEGVHHGIALCRLVIAGEQIILATNGYGA